MNRKERKKRIKRYVKEKVEHMYPDETEDFTEKYVKMCFVNMSEDCKNEDTPIAVIIREIVDEMDPLDFKNSQFKKLE